LKKEEKMKKHRVTFLVLALAFLMSSCVTSFYHPIAVTKNPIGTKVGQANWREGAILKAAQNGGITRIATVDLIVDSTGNRTYVVSGE
jgi:starvation-inducible outer membrane lipoprotein